MPMNTRCTTCQKNLHSQPKRNASPIATPFEASNERYTDTLVGFSCVLGKSMEKSMPEEGVC